MVPDFEEFILQYFSMHSTVMEQLLPGTVPGVKNIEMSKIWLSHSRGSQSERELKQGHR